MTRVLSPVLMAGLLGYRRYFAGAAAFSFFINALTLCIPLYTIQIYDRVLVSGSGATLAVLTVGALGGLLAAAALDDIRSRLLVALGLNFDERLSVPLFERRVETSLGGEGGSAGQTIRDLDSVRHVLTGSGALALFDLPWTPLFLMAVFYLHPVLGSVTLLGTIVTLALAVANQWLVAGPLRASTEETEASYRLTESVMRNAEIVNALGMLPDLSRRWASLRSSAVERQATASVRNASVSSAIKLLRYALQIAILATGAWLAVNRELSPGALFAASMLCTRALMPIDQAVAVWRQLVSGWAALQRVETALAVPGRPRAMKLPTPEGRLNVDNLSYLPPGARVPTLVNVTFSVAPGEAIGIVGPSAAGKSTLARLIVGAIKPSDGSVRLDGAETYSWDRGDFGSLVGYVPQGIELLQGTISENIARFRDADSFAVVAAAKMVGVHEMVLSLPLGYGTMLAASGAPLSGGQRQRIALARAVFGQPKLVVLDEPNSNLDGEGEAVLVALVSELKARGATVLMIAHRPSVLVALDKVLVLANGALRDYDTVEKVMPRIAPGYRAVPKRLEARA
ncbi:MAG TPA: type I secretion system permease/ATPase [Hyphomicrobiaceae bacterium]|nr:type I secretion system permease/ATPase [Hyphomicrobiaceae bacterium]